MTDERLVDYIRITALEAGHELGIDEQVLARLAEIQLRRIQEAWGGGRHYVHAMTAEERAAMVARDGGHPNDVARSVGVSVSTVYRARRRVISGDVR